MTLVPGKLTAVDTEGSSDRPASAKQAPVGTVGGVFPSGFLSQARLRELCPRDSRGLPVPHLLPPTRDGGPPARWAQLVLSRMVSLCFALLFTLCL